MRTMPTILREGPYRFYFVSGDRNEPLHMHVRRDKNVAKFWLDPVRLASGGGFSAVELRRVERVRINSRTKLVEGWHGNFNAED